MIKIDGLTSMARRDPHYSNAEDLARRSAIELQELNVNHRNELIEAERLRAITEASSRSQAEGSRGIQADLRELDHTLREGNESLSSAMAAVGDQISGIPRRTKNLGAFLATGEVDETEIIVLSGVLDREQKEKFFRSLDYRKIWLIEHVNNIPAGKVLTREENEFLNQLRNKRLENPINFRSLVVLWREGFLDEDFRRTLADRNPEFRSGLEAVKFEVRDVGRDLGNRVSTLISQGEIQTELQEVMADDIGTLVTQGETALELMDEGNDLDRDSLLVQESTLDETRISRGLAENAERDRREIINLAMAAAKDRQTLIDSICSLFDAVRHYEAEAQDMRRTQLATTREFGELQAAQMGEAQDARLVSLDKLTDINDVLRAIASAQLTTHGSTLDALDNLRQIFSSGFGTVVQGVDAVRQTLMDMEARAIERDQNSGRNLAQQSFKKAMSMLQIGNIDKAIEFLNEAENNWTADAKVYFHRALCNMAKDDPRAAERDFSYAIKATKEDESKARSLIRQNLARLYYDEAKSNLRNGNQAGYEERLQTAIEEGKRAVAEDPKFLDAQFELAVYLAENKSFYEALKILMDIIPENPNFIKRIDDFAALTPLRKALKNTLGEDADARKNVGFSQANLNIAKDCMELGYIETAKKRLNSLFEKDPEFLRKSKIWEMPEFDVLSEDIAEMAKRFLSQADQHESEWGYGVVGTALHLDKMTKGSIYTAFKTAVEKDQDFQNKNHEKIREKCVALAGDKADVLFRILHTKLQNELPEWLINSL